MCLLCKQKRKRAPSAFSLVIIMHVYVLCFIDISIIVCMYILFNKSVRVISSSFFFLLPFFSLSISVFYLYLLDRITLGCFSFFFLYIALSIVPLYEHMYNHIVDWWRWQAHHLLIRSKRYPKVSISLFGIDTRWNESNR
jgi:hypothetical protein